MTDARGSWQRAWNDTKKKEKEEKMPRDRGRCSRGNAGGRIPYRSDGGHRKGEPNDQVDRRRGRIGGPETRGYCRCSANTCFSSFVKRNEKKREKKKKTETQFSKGKIASVARPFRR